MKWMASGSEIRKMSEMTEELFWLLKSATTSKESKKNRRKEFVRLLAISVPGRPTSLLLHPLSDFAYVFGTYYKHRYKVSLERNSSKRLNRQCPFADTYDKRKLSGGSCWCKWRYGPCLCENNSASLRLGNAHHDKSFSSGDSDVSRSYTVGRLAFVRRPRRRCHP